MAGNDNLIVQMVELLGVWPAEAKVGSPPVKEPVVVITVRPYPGSNRSHNLGISLAQAQRLFEDLASVLQRSVVLLMLAVLAWIPTDPHRPNDFPGQVPILPACSPNCYRTTLS